MRQYVCTAADHRRTCIGGGLGEQLIMGAVWERLGTLLPRGGRKYVAIAYVTAPDLLSIGSGDLVVVDASPAAVASGGTDPSALRRWAEAGADVRSRSGVHAKIIVTRSSTVVGSANASANSAEYLSEAVLVTNSADIRRQPATSSRLWPMTLHRSPRTS